MSQTARAVTEQSRLLKVDERKEVLQVLNPQQFCGESMKGKKCPKCNQVNEPSEQCGKCMWIAKTTPLMFQLQASSVGTVGLKVGPRYYVYDRTERVPDWVHIRYVPLDQWEGELTPPIHLKRSKPSLSLTDRQRFMESSFIIPDLTADVSDAGTSRLSEVIQDLVSADPDADVNIVALILRDNEENRGYLTKYCAKLVLAADNSYWVSANLPNGRTKTMRLGFWFTDYHFIDEDTKLVMLGKFEEGHPIFEIRLSDTTMLVSGVPSVESEYAARDFLREKLELAEDDFEYEPNGHTTFPDWSMCWKQQTWNVEVTRAKEEVRKNSPNGRPRLA